MKNLMRRFIEEESGATMVEYAILVALISVAAIAAITALGPLILQAFTDVVTAMGGTVP